MFPEIGREFPGGPRRGHAGGRRSCCRFRKRRRALRPETEGVPTEFVVDVHGETYRVDITGVGVAAEGKRRFFLSRSTACRKRWCSSR